MDAPAFVWLDLRVSLDYVKYPVPMPLWYSRGAGENADPEITENCCGMEQLFCFKLDPVQSRSIEPESGQFLDTLLFSAYLPQQEQGRLASVDGNQADAVQLPAGVYLFTQKKATLEKEACIDMAIEQQKDGLWERHKLQSLLYIRFLFEDGKHVTQIFRPVEA